MKRLRDLRMRWLWLLVLVGCAQGPTKTFEQPVVKSGTQVIDENVILIDARPAFESAVSRPPGALVLQWNDFTQIQTPFEAHLQADRFQMVRRLARMGIAQDSKVLVLGNGLDGHFEEGRVAWTLQVLGLKNVTLARAESFLQSRGSLQSRGRPEQENWKPVEVSDLEMDTREGLRLAQEGQVVILDVRPVGSPDEPARRGMKYFPYLEDRGLWKSLLIKAPVLRTPWKNFLNADGSVRTEVLSDLESKGLTKEKKILVVDELGIQSAGVTFILRQLGFNEARNWTGSFKELDWIQRHEPQKRSKKKSKSKSPKKKR